MKYLDYDGLKYLYGKIKALLNKKVDKIDGKGLSTRDYTSEEKSKLSDIEDGAEVNVQADWNVSDETSDAYIRNKPTSLPAAPHNHDSEYVKKGAVTWNDLGGV